MSPFMRVATFGLQIPTDPLTISESQNQEISKLYVVQKRCATDFKAPQLGKGWPRWMQKTNKNMVSFIFRITKQKMGLQYKGQKKRKKHRY